MGSIGQFDCQYPLVCDIRLIHYSLAGLLEEIYTLLGLDIPYICALCLVYMCKRDAGTGLQVL